MIREILTLVVDKIPTPYYIFFEKGRKQFSFQPTLNHKSAPSFEITVVNGEMNISAGIDDFLSTQAKEKVKEILNNPVFDHL